MTKYASLILIFFALSVCSMMAQNEMNTKTIEQKDVFKNLLETNSEDAVVHFYQDKRIEHLFLERQALSNGEEISGFRVQVFSSNIQRTGKSEAFRIKALVEENFPRRGVYETYTSPFWRVRVGDCRTREEAQELLAELAKSFPSMRHEIYIVPDKIIVPGSR